MPFVLVITDREDSALIRRLSRKQITPMIRRSIESVIDLIRHHQVGAIIIDEGRRGPDLLELILNVRDTDPKTPIIVNRSILNSKVKTLVNEMDNIRLSDGDEDSITQNLMQIMTQNADEDLN